MMKVKINTSFTRFLLVGVLNTFVGLSVTYLFLNAIKLGYWPSTFLGNSIGAIVSYMLNKSFTFKSNASVISSFTKFLIIILFCYFISYTVSLSLTKTILNFIGFTDSTFIDNLAVLIGAGMYTILNYIGQKYIVFKK